MRHPAGLSSFFCQSCPQAVTLFTSAERLELLVSWLNDRGHTKRFEEETEIYAFGRLVRSVPAERAPFAIHIDVHLDTQEQAIIEVRLGEWRRPLRLIRDVIRPRVQIELLSEGDTNNTHEYMVFISFSERVVWESEPLDCPSMSRINRWRQNASNILRQSDACSNNLLEKDIAAGIRVRGGDFLIRHLNRNAALSVIIQTESKNRTADIEITVDGGYRDFAGNRLREGKQRIIYYRPFPPPKRRQDRLLKRDVVFPEKKRFSGKAMGRAATVAVAGASAASFASSSGKIAFFFAIMTRALCISGGSSGSSVTMINNVQKLHMTGMLAVARLPPNYQNFTGEVKWAVLDIKTPWENNNNTRRRNETRTSQRTLKFFDAAFEAGEEEEELDYFGRMMFWIPALFIVVCTLHAIVIAYFVFFEKPLPDILQPPRLELMLAFFSLPPISIACAGLYKTDREKAMLATWILVAVPGLFITWNFYMLWVYVLHSPPHLREVNLITNIPNKKQKAFRRVRRIFTRDKRKVSASHHRSMGSSVSTHATFRTSSKTDPETVQMAVQPRPNQTEDQQTMHREAVMEEPDPHDAGADGKDHDRALTCAEIMESISNMTLLSLLLGEHQEEAEWVTTKTQGSKFHARFGVLFEEHRGPAIGRRDVTLDVDPVTGRVDRGELVILRERPIFMVPHLKRENSHFRLGRKNIYRYYLQIMAKLLDITKTILVGCIVAGAGDTDDNIYSIVALIALSLILILLLRIAKPFPSRVDMILLLLTEVADLIVYTCALFLIIGPDTDEDTDENIGLALLFSEAFALVAMVMEYSILSIGLTMEGYDEWKEMKEHKFFELVHKLMMQNEVYLQKKYFDRWMVRAFSRGLHGRQPERHELHWKVAVKIYVQYGWSGVRWLMNECMNIWNDGLEKIARRKRREILQGPSSTMRHDGPLA